MATHFSNLSWQQYILISQLRNSRESSVIVTGLTPDATKSNTELFASLCNSEYHFQPNVASVKRLGRQLTDRTQPLPVYLKQTDQTQQLIGSAKTLRQSSDPIIREKFSLIRI
jgi:hypothetical protein